VARVLLLTDDLMFGSRLEARRPALAHRARRAALLAGLLATAR